MRQGADHVSAPRPPGLKEPAVGTCHQRHCGKGDANDQLTNAAACRRFGWFINQGRSKNIPSIAGNGLVHTAFALYVIASGQVPTESGRRQTSRSASKGPETAANNGATTSQLKALFG